MKLNVKFRNEWFVIPVKKENNLKVEWLIKETIENYLTYSENKYKKLNQINTDTTVHTNSERSDDCDLKELNELLNDVIDVRKNSNNAIINRNDLIDDVLENNEFICIVLKSELLEIYEDRNYINLKNNISTSVNEKEKKTFYLDGYTLNPNDLYQLGSGCFKIDLTETAWKNVKEGRNLLENLIKDNKIVYGINTGFGKFANTIIDKSDLKQLQLNLIRSHASGVGEILSIPRTRRLLVLRINVLAKGHSGISVETLQSLIKAFNADCLPLVPEQGTVGASGDLAPLSHLALGMIGEGKMWSPSTGWASSKLVLHKHNLTPIELKPKEGIALINGTQLITSLGAEAVTKSKKIAEQADIVAALSIEVLKGTTRAFDPHIHELRPHPGQIKVAEKLRSLTHSEIYHSDIAESHRFCNRVQDAYTLRCCPQVHGIVHETIDFVNNIIKVEMNSATDNPLVIPKLSECISGGNFHGEYPAKACDYLAIGVHELSSMSERRIERLVNTSLSGLPLFLIENGGLCSGLMIPHCTSASLVSENKVYCHPSSIDSLSTSAGTEDHVSMGGFSARKALKVVENVEKVIAIELLAACQAMEFLRPLKSTEPLEKVYELVRSVVDRLDTDRFMAPEIEKVHQLLKENAVYNCVKPYMDNYNLKIKAVKKKISVASRPSSPTTFYSNTYESLQSENQKENEE